MPLTKADIVKRNIRKFRREGGTLEQALGKVSPEGHVALRAIWAEVESERVRKTPSYREAIEYIAMNDEPTITDPELLLGQPTVQMLAMMFGKDADEVAEDVVAFRQKHA